MKILVVLGGLALVALIVVAQSLYVVDVTEQVLITRFGDPQTVSKNPGIYLKAPFVDTALSFDKRVLRIDAPAVSMPDIDKQNMTIDSYARYRIVDPLQFFKTLQTENTARTRLGDIVTSSLRDEIARSSRTQIIGAERVLDANGVPVIDDDGLPIIEASESRSELLENVFEASKARVEEGQFGVEMIDVRMKRADFSDRVQDAIYNRMRAERNRIATRFRSEGEEEDLKIRAQANKQREIILAEAERTGNEVRGRGEAEAIRILADALNQDPEFFAFRRSLESYQKFLNQRTTVILSSDADLFKFLQEPPGQQGSAKQ
ncbi:MAG: protease modulator HflC [Chloroflexota bacterium]|nr:protease modulator HflC [Chloroflexota bacterium]